MSTRSPPERNILRARSCMRPSIDSAAFLPSIARLSNVSSTGSRACASSRVKVLSSSSITIWDHVCNNLAPYLQHAVESDPSPVFHVVAHADAIDDAALDKVFQRPAKMLRADAIHGSA